MIDVLNIPWLELSILLCLLGAVCISQVRHPVSAMQWGLCLPGIRLHPLRSRMLAE